MLRLAHGDRKMPRNLHRFDRKAYDRATEIRYASVAFSGASQVCAAGSKIVTSAGGGGLTAPTYVANGGMTPGSGSGTITPALPTNASGDLFVCVACDFAQGARPTLPAGWTSKGTNTSGSFVIEIFTRDTRSSGSESGTINVSVNSTASRVAIYTFRGVATSSFIESTATVAGSAGTCNGPSITTSGTGRLAVAWYWADGTTAAPNSGSSGGTWTEASELFDGTNLLQQLQTCATLGSGSTISGGSSAFTSGAFGAVCRAFALVGI
jgi:hypothetical protein